MQRSLTRCLLFALALGLFGPARSAAGIMIITSGTAVKHVGVIPEAQRKAALQAQLDGLLNRGQIDVRNLGMMNPAVGYRYNHFSLFWLEVWTWKGSFCLYEGRREVPIRRDVAAALLGKEPGELRKPFAYSFPPGLLVLGGIFLLSIPATIHARRKVLRTQSLFADPRYQHALQLYRQGNQNEAAFEEAVLSLEREGIERGEAIRNLRSLLAHLSQQHEARVG